MATYLVAIGKTSTLSKLASLLSENSSVVQNEQKISHVSATSSVLVMGKNIECNVNDNPNGQFFSGWMLDHQSSSLFLGQTGFEEGELRHQYNELETNEGSFIHAEWNEKSLTIRHDCFGLYPILYFSSKEIFVACDSLLVLARIRTLLGYENKMNHHVHATRSWTTGIANSIMSTSTLVKGIHYLPPASSITVTHMNHSRKYKLSIDKNIANFPAVFRNPEEPYTSALLQSIKQIVGSVSAIQSLPEFEIKFGLSGGLDSRVLLAILKYNQTSIANIDIRSNIHPSRLTDLQVVEGLSEKYSFSFNKNDHTKEIENRSGAKPIRVKNMFGNWALSNLGMFDMMYMYSSYWNHPAVIEMGGNGAEIVKGTFSQTNLFQIAFRKKPKQYFELRTEIKNGLKAIHCSFRQKNMMQWHHLGYKSSIQGGRFTDRTLLALRPLMNRYLCSMGLNIAKDTTNTILQDMLIILDPELARFPFDDEKKNITEEYIDSTLLGLSKINKQPIIEPYQIFGTSSDIKNGMLESFSEFGNDFVIESEDIREDISRTMENVWNGIKSKKIKKQYAQAYQLAKQKLADSESYVPSAGVYAAKIIQLSLVD